MLNFEHKFISKKPPEKILAEILLVDSDLSVRAYQALRVLSITNLEELTKYSENELIKGGSGINSKIIQEITELLAKYNLSLKKDQA